MYLPLDVWASDRYSENVRQLYKDTFSLFHLNMNPGASYQVSGNKKDHLITDELY